MRRRALATLLGWTLALTLATAIAPNAHADPAPAPPRPDGATVTWGGRGSPSLDAAASQTAPVPRAREMLTRAKALEEAATNDERASTEIAARLPALRMAAKVARDRADRAAGDERAPLLAHAEELEADVIVSEAEVVWKRATAVENRRVARELRQHAVRLVREAKPGAAAVGLEPVAPACDPPFNFTADGRKVYRVECLK